MLKGEDIYLCNVSRCQGYSWQTDLIFDELPDFLVHETVFGETEIDTALVNRIDRNYASGILTSLLGS